MANATVKYKEVIRPIESVTLTLNQDELLVLTAILNRIGGCPDKSPRKHAASILNAIVNGVEPEIRDYEKVSELVDYSRPAGTIYFAEYYK
jgi:hypothetical protein